MVDDLVEVRYGTVDEAHVNSPIAYGAEKVRKERGKRVAPVTLQQTISALFKYAADNRASKTKFHQLELERCSLEVVSGPTLSRACFLNKIQCGRPVTHAELKRCSGCKVAHYCSKVCQREDWDTHKIDCRQHCEDLSCRFNTTLCP